ELFEGVWNCRARSKIGEALLRKADQLVANGTLPVIAQTLKAHDLVAGIEPQGGPLPRLGGAELYFARHDAAADWRAVAPSQRIETLECSSRLTASHECSSPWLAHSELVGLKNTARLPER